MAGGARPVVDDGLDGGALTDRDAGHAGAYLDHGAGEFMAKGDRDLLAGDGMRGKRGKVGTAEILVEIWGGISQVSIRLHHNESNDRLLPWESFGH